MEIVDANAGLLSNFEVYSFLTDPQRNNYPSYDLYQRQVEVQKQSEYSSSFLSARDAAKLAATRQAADEAARADAEASGDPSLAPPPPLPFPRDLKSLENTCWVLSRVQRYLSSTPAATQSAESCSSFLSRAKELLAERGKARGNGAEEEMRLTVCEVMQLLNLRPSSLVEIHRCIEECEERLTEEDSSALLRLVEQTLPSPPPRAAPVPQEEQQDEQGEQTAMEIEAVAAAQ